MSPLSPRHAELAALVAAGRNNAEIASAMSITLGTVKVMMSRLYKKLGFDGAAGNPRVRLALWHAQAAAVTE